MVKFSKMEIGSGFLMKTTLTGIIMNLLTSSLFNMHVIRSYSKDERQLLKITQSGQENRDLAITNNFKGRKCDPTSFVGVKFPSKYRAKSTNLQDQK